MKISDQINSFAERTNLKLLPKLPVVIIINGRGFSKITALLDKPFSDKLAECFYSALLRLVQEIDGAVFGYTFNDEIIIIARNDQNQETQPWYDNNIQKITSVSSSIATLQFNNYAAGLDLNLMGDAIFHAQAFVVPSIMDAVNVIIMKQQQSAQSSLSQACFYELLNKYDKNDIKDILAGTSIEDKINLLNQEAGIDYKSYSPAFRRGVACYRSPKVVSYEGESLIKNKWNLNADLPIFTKESSFLNSIIKSGTDIIRGA